MLPNKYIIIVIIIIKVVYLELDSMHKQGCHIPNHGLLWGFDSILTVFITNQATAHFSFLLGTA